MSEDSYQTELYHGPPTGLYEIDRFREALGSLYPTALVNPHQDRANPPKWKSLAFFVPETDLHIRYFVQGVNGSTEATAWADAPEEGPVSDLVSKLKELEN